MSDVRAILACLASAEVARVFATIVLQGTPPEDLSPSRQRKAIDSLLRSGLVTVADDRFSLDTPSIRAALRGVSEPSPKSVPDPMATWLDTTGKIRQYPRQVKQRTVLLHAIGEKVLAVEDRVSEATLNERLERYTSDIPTLRRYLIVYGVLERESDGSAYWRAST